jgi:hypothetical protein
MVARDFRGLFQLQQLGSREQHGAGVTLLQLLRRCGRLSTDGGGFLTEHLSALTEMLSGKYHKA